MSTAHLKLFKQVWLEHLGCLPITKVNGQHTSKVLYRGMLTLFKTRHGQLKSVLA